MSALYEVIGTSVAETLLTSPEGAMKIAVPLTANKGVAKRGSILKRVQAGTWELAAVGDIDGTCQIAILNVEVNTAASTTIPEDADVFIAGRFAESKLVLASNGTLTAAAKIVLRNQGIIVEPIVA